MYTELHARSAFSFLEGASLPENLVRTAAMLDLPGIALLDRDGIYGAPRFYLEAKKLGIRAYIGAEVTVESFKLQSPYSVRYPLLVKNREGYKNLCRLITRYQLKSNKKGMGQATSIDLQDYASGLICLTGGEGGPLDAALNYGGYEAGKKEVEKLCFIYGTKNVYIELQRHSNREEEFKNQAAIKIAKSFNIPLLATNGVRYASPQEREILDVFTCVKNHCQLETSQKLLENNSERHLRSHKEMVQLFSDLPSALSNTKELSSRLEFNLSDLGYEFPKYPVPPGESMMSFLCQRTREGFNYRYSLKKNHRLFQQARIQIERELKLIQKLNLEGYFLIVWDIVRFCKEIGILAQGRGSAANSVVCYALGITAVDPISMDLLFERFLSEQRSEWPDIDIDLPSGKDRERVIQYVYQRYGKLGAAMTANVITYQKRSAYREVGKVLGFNLKTQNQISALIETQDKKDTSDRLEHYLYQSDLDRKYPRIAKYIELCQNIRNLPRNLGQHSGGMVICQGQLDSIVPLEPATMAGRVVVQWDKKDCAEMGIVKVDLLGLGMMAVIKDCLELVPKTYGDQINLHQLPPNDPKVFKTLQKADTVGMFQIESRAQMSALPRNHPNRFYDLVVQVAIIRPGPIVGKMTHPYLQRRQGKQAVKYPHPSLKPILERTLGVPLFQEQLLRIAMTAANFSGGEAEELRQALGSKRSQEKMSEIELKLRSGMEENGIPKEAQSEIILSITSFALYGFPESHAASFALIAYASAYLKCHYLAAFTASLLNNQPMGFYSIATIIKDAQQHGLPVKPVDILCSDWLCTLEKDPLTNIISLRLGLNQVRGLPQSTATILMEKRKNQKFYSLENLIKHVPQFKKKDLRTLAQIGAFNSFKLGLNRRDMLWQVERVIKPLEPLFTKSVENLAPSPLNPMSDQERLVADFYGIGSTLGSHPMKFCRQFLDKINVSRTIDLKSFSHGQRIRVAGHVIVRQKPRTAKGFVFISLEDETGISNVIITPNLYNNQRILFHQENFLLIEGTLQNQERVISIKAEVVHPLQVTTAKIQSHDFY